MTALISVVIISSGEILNSKISSISSSKLTALIIPIHTIRGVSVNVTVTSMTFINNNYLSNEWQVVLLSNFNYASPG